MLSEQSFDYGRKQYEYSSKEEADITNKMHAMSIDADKKCQELKSLYDNSLKQLQDDQRTQLTAQLRSMSSRYDEALLEQTSTMQAARST